MSLTLIWYEKTRPHGTRGGGGRRGGTGRPDVSVCWSFGMDHLDTKADLLLLLYFIRSLLS
jgi:hypothetical protein